MTKAFTIPSRNIHTIVRAEVMDVVREVLSDPDAGLELSTSFTRRLKKSLQDKKAGRVTSLSKVLKLYDI